MPEQARLLMVDDNPGDVGLTRLALEEAGLQVDMEIAPDGVAARAFLEQVRDGVVEPVHAMLLDLNMPRMDGRMLLGWARSEPALHGLPIIIFTSSRASQEQHDCMQKGATAYWVKPSNFDAYVALIAGLQRFLPPPTPPPEHPRGPLGQRRHQA